MQDLAVLAPDYRALASGRKGSGYLWILLLLVAVVHVPSLFHPFFIDDYVYLDRVRDLDWQSVWRILTSPTMDESASGVWWVPIGTLPFYRPIGQLSFALDFTLSGMNPFGYHLTNLLLHLACTALTWRLALRLFGVPAYALATATVFSLHPVHGEAVMWISGRFDLLVCACVLASVLSYLRWKDVRGWGWAGLSVFWFAVGLGCKETALILPIVLAGTELLSRRGRTRRALVVFAAVGAVALFYVAGRIALFGSFTGRLPPPYGLDTSHPWSALQALALNLSVYVLDLGLFAHVDLVYLSQIWREHPVLFGAAVAVASLILLAAAIIGRSRVSRIGLAWLAIFTAPSLLSMPGERNVYLASVGLALLVAAAFRAIHGNFAPLSSHGPSLPARRWLRPASYAVVAVFLIACVIQQVLMGRITAAGDKVYSDLQALLPDPPPGARIYVVNQNPLNSVGFSQALRLRYGRSDLSGCALTVSPTLGASSTDRVLSLGPDSIRIVREGGLFFSSFVERFHRFGDPVSTLAAAGQRAELELLNPPTSYDNLMALEFRFAYPLSDPRVHVLYWDNHQVRGRLDLLWIEGLTQLRQYEPAELEAARASQAPVTGL
jgi:hypothetical protein